VLAIPRFLAAVSARQYVTAWAELLQVVLLDTLAILIGQRVSSERDARRSAEMSRLAHLNAEAMYRDLFDSNQAPILIIDHDGLVVETNAAAQWSFAVERPVGSGSAPVRLVDMIGPDAAARILTQLISWRTPSEGRTGGSPSESERVEPLPFEIAGERVLFSGVAKQAWELDAGIGAGGRGILAIQMESVEEIARVDARARAAGRRARVGLRITDDRGKNRYLCLEVVEERFGRQFGFQFNDRIQELRLIEVAQRGTTIKAGCRRDPRVRQGAQFLQRSLQLPARFADVRSDADIGPRHSAGAGNCRLR